MQAVAWIRSRLVRGASVSMLEGVFSALTRQSAPQKPLEEAFRLNPDLRIFDICGYYDLGANCAGDARIARSMGPTIANNVTVRLYEGGHAPCYVAKVMTQMKLDFGDFVREIAR